MGIQTEPKHFNSLYSFLKCHSEFPQLWRVYAGSTNLEEGGEYRPAGRFVVHENYSAANNWINDIALIQVRK
jgi:hypothetical protein